MAPTRFTYHDDGTVTSEDRTLTEALPGILGRGLLLGRIPSGPAVVGHCQVGPHWCVFAREQGQVDFHGFALSDQHYAKAEYDPFVAAATYLEGRSVRDAVHAGPVEPPSSGIAADADEPLRAAYRCFLDGDPSLRQGAYVSILPPGLAPQISPLTCLAVVGRHADDEGSAAATSGPSPPTGGSRAVRRVSATADTMTLATGVEPRPPVDEDASEASWESIELDRGGDAVAASRPPRPEPTEATDLERRMTSLEDRLSSTRRVFAVALVATLLAGIGAGAALEHRIRRAAAASVPLATLTEGLGVEAPPDETLPAVAAHLRDLSTVAVQSGAWQAVLERRGVERDIFIDRLVDLSSRQKELLALADAQRPLATLATEARALGGIARSAADLEAVAASRQSLVDLAGRHDGLILLADSADDLRSLAGVSASLQGLAGSAVDLEKLASNADGLTALAADRRNIQTVADQHAALAALAADSTALRTLAADGAELMVFWERYGTAVQDLARQQESLSSLAERHRTIARLVEESPAIYALTAKADALLALLGPPAEPGSP